MDSKKNEKFRERYWDAKMISDGNTTLILAPYNFYLNDYFPHFGIDLFYLIKMILFRKLITLDAPKIKTINRSCFTPKFLINKIKRKGYAYGLGEKSPTFLWASLFVFNECYFGVTMTFQKQQFWFFKIIPC